MYDASKCAARVIARRVKMHGASKFTVGQNVQQEKLCDVLKCAVLPQNVQRLYLRNVSKCTFLHVRQNAQRVKLRDVSKCAVLRQNAQCAKFHHVSK